MALSGLQFGELFDIDNDVSLVNGKDYYWIVEQMSEKRWFLFSVQYLEMHNALNKGLKIVRSKHLCKTIDLKGEIDWTFYYERRIWGYTSKGFSKVFAAFLHAGFYMRGYAFRYAMSQNKISSLELKKVDGFMEPHPVKLFSLLGVTCAAVVTVGALLYILWMVVWAGRHVSPLRKKKWVSWRKQSIATDCEIYDSTSIKDLHLQEPNLT